MVLIPYVTAFLIHAFAQKDKYDTKMPDEDEAWMFVAAIIFNRMVLTLNFYPGQFKNKFSPVSTQAI